MAAQLYVVWPRFPELLGRDDSGGNDSEEPEDRDGHIRGSTVGIGKPWPVAYRTPQCRRGLCEDLR